ncbi:unnamed protein product [Amoebophrya sp. A120]|nr:unnamed protein product [Amoebophrya sp. A120]|eukprot:GSA120T00019531001.1
MKRFHLGSFSTVATAVALLCSVFAFEGAFAVEGNCKITKEPAEEDRPLSLNWVKKLFPAGATIQIHNTKYTVKKDGTEGQNHSGDGGWFSGQVTLRNEATKAGYILKLFKTAEGDKGEEFNTWRENIYKGGSLVATEMKKAEHLGNQAHLYFESIGDDALEMNAPCWFEGGKVMGVLIKISCSDGKLSQLFDMKSLPLEERKKMWPQIKKLLEHLEAKRLVHFDLHYENVMVCEIKTERYTVRRALIVDLKSVEQLPEEGTLWNRPGLTVKELLEMKQGHLMEPDQRLLHKLRDDGITWGNTAANWQAFAGYMASYVKKSWLEHEGVKAPGAGPQQDVADAGKKTGALVVQPLTVTLNKK